MPNRYFWWAAPPHSGGELSAAPRALCRSAHRQCPLLGLRGWREWLEGPEPAKQLGVWATQGSEEPRPRHLLAVTLGVAFRPLALSVSLSGANRERQAHSISAGCACERPPCVASREWAVPQARGLGPEGLAVRQTPHPSELQPTPNPPGQDTGDLTGDPGCSP